MWIKSCFIVLISAFFSIHSTAQDAYPAAKSPTQYAPTDIKSESDIKSEIFKNLDKIEGCRNILWNGHDLGKKKILLVDDKNGVVHEWPSRKTFPITNELKSKHYTFTKLQWGNPKQDAMAYKMDALKKKGSLNGTGFIIHENFHLTMQKSWKETYKGSRSTDFPFSHEPRYYRKQLENSLKSALKSSGKEREKKLREAAHWHKKHSQFAGGKDRKNLHTCDLKEGTAEHMETVAKSIVKQGSCLSRKEHAELIAKDIHNHDHSGHNHDHSKRPQNPNNVCKEDTGSTPILNAASECYKIGTLAGAVLDQIPQKSNWRALVENTGKTQLDILFKDINPTPIAPDNASIKNNMVGEAEKTNKLIEPKVKSIDENINNSKKYIKLSITAPPWKHQTRNSHGPSGRFNIDDKTYMLGTFFKVGDLDFSNQEVVVEKNHGCGKTDSVITVVVPKSSLSRKNGKLIFDQTKKSPTCKKPYGLKGSLNASDVKELPSENRLCISQ